MTFLGRHPALRNALIGFSLANLLFVRVWARLFIAPDQYYFFKALPHRSVYALALLGVTVLGAVLACAGHWAIRAQGRYRTLAKAGLLLAAALVINGVRHQYRFLSVAWLVTRIGPLWTVGLGASIVLGLILALRRRLDRAILLVVAALLALLPYAFFNLGRAVLALVNPATLESGVVAGGARLPSGEGGRTRVVILLFDELDQETLSERRPSELLLPEWDRLRNEAIELTQATSPSGVTLTAIPSLLTGRRVVRARPAAPSDLRLTFAGSEEEQSWSTSQDVFTDAASLGRRSAIAGWYHPYCRVLADRLDVCHWYAHSPVPGPDWDQNARWVVGVTLESVPGLLHVDMLEQLGVGWLRTAGGNRGGWSREWHRRQFDRIRGEALRLVADPALDLIYVHFPIPHHPGIGPAIPASEGDWYYGNLRLVDQSLGKVRVALEAAGLWDRTAVIVTSDHWWRSKPGGEPCTPGGKNALRCRVPLLLKLPGGSEHSVFEEPLETTIVRGLALDLLRGAVSTASTAREWLTARRSEQASLSDDRSGVAATED